MEVKIGLKLLNNLLDRYSVFYLDDKLIDDCLHKLNNLRFDYSYLFDVYPNPDVFLDVKNDKKYNFINNKPIGEIIKDQFLFFGSGNGLLTCKITQMDLLRQYYTSSNHDYTLANAYEDDCLGLILATRKSSYKRYNLTIEGFILCKYTKENGIEFAENNFINSNVNKNSNSLKRTDYLSWNEYFINIAEISAQRSKDPKTQVGACIVRDNKILSVGYNGFPNGISDDKFPWNSEGTSLEKIKDAYVVHAELNAILNGNFDLKDSILYTTLFPCNECAKAIIQVGIKKIFYRSKKDNEKERIALKMFKEVGIEVEQI